MTDRISHLDTKRWSFKYCYLGVSNNTGDIKNINNTNNIDIKNINIRHINNTNNINIKNTNNIDIKNTNIKNIKNTNNINNINHLIINRKFDQRTS